MDLRHGFDIKRYIRTIPDYPKKGILFRDITTLLANLHAFRAAVDELAWPFLVAHQVSAGFVPIRKKGKLPHRVIGQDYALEYGVDTIEIHADAISKGDRILLIDDLVATGGTANAAIDLIRKSAGDVVAAAFVIDLPDIGGSQRLRDKGVKIHTLVSFEGH
ncbi:MAG: purine phosphoribosyltransferase family protein [Alphaproteobacteria bacterium]|nr:MAG: purine phosphoribosyltransferase family protein [Alphaproteobacteria bacterium]